MACERFCSSLCCMCTMSGQGGLAELFGNQVARTQIICVVCCAGKSWRGWQKSWAHLCRPRQVPTFFWALVSCVLIEGPCCNCLARKGAMHQFCVRAFLCVLLGLSCPLLAPFFPAADLIAAVLLGIAVIYVVKCLCRSMICELQGSTVVWRRVSCCYDAMYSVTWMCTGCVATCSVFCEGPGLLRPMFVQQHIWLTKWTLLVVIHTVQPHLQVVLEYILPSIQLILCMSAAVWALFACFAMQL